MARHNTVAVKSGCSMMRPLTIILAVLCLVAASARERRQTTRVSPRRTSAPSAYVALAADTIARNLIAVTGYEKPLRARKETFMVHNAHPADTLQELTLELTYMTVDGAMLHRRSVTVYPQIPPGQRHMVTTPSWDVNTVFYYHLNKPVRAYGQATPYTVSITVTEALKR